MLKKSLCLIAAVILFGLVLDKNNATYEVSVVNPRDDVRINNQANNESPIQTAGFKKHMININQLVCPTDPGPSLPIPKVRS